MYIDYKIRELMTTPASIPCILSDVSMEHRYMSLHTVGAVVKFSVIHMLSS
jgi:hypothetical protein